jgi:predicted dehydrogenase
MIRFGIVGTGKISGWVLEGALQDSRFEAVAVCSRSQATADAFVASHSGRPMRTYTSLEEMAGSPDIDAVYIASPNSEHAAQSILCMNHGKHVLCEKPLASNAAEARKMVETARRNHVVLMEAMIATLNPNFKIVKSMLPQLGTIRRYFASYCQYSSRYDQLKDILSSSNAASGTGVFPGIANAFNPATSGSAALDVGVYAIYPMIALFGKPQEIEAIGTLLPTGTDGQGAVNFKYDSGMEATVLYSKIAESYLPSEIDGESGSLIMDQIHIIRNVAFVPHFAPMSGRGPKPERSAVGIQLDRNEYFYEIEEFIDLVEASRLSKSSYPGSAIAEAAPESSVNSLETSVATMEVLDEIRRRLGIVFPADTDS